MLHFPHISLQCARGQLYFLLCKLKLKMSHVWNKTRHFDMCKITIGVTLKCDGNGQNFQNARLDAV